MAAGNHSLNRKPFTNKDGAEAMWKKNKTLPKPAVR
jgi:hypothetical protein